jgi:hypothetical protein
MYRVTVTQDPKEPSAVVYQGIEEFRAHSIFHKEVDEAPNTCVVLCVWIANEKRGVWKTKRLYKAYQ